MRMFEKIKILIIEDSVASAEYIKRSILKSGIDAVFGFIQTLNELEKIFDNLNYDIIITDYVLDGFDALDVIEYIRSINTIIPVVIISGAVGEENAVQGMRLGANDFLKKQNLNRLPSIIKREINSLQIKIQNEKKDKCLKELNLKLEEKVQEQKEKINTSLKRQKQISEELKSTKNFLNTILSNVPNYIIAKDFYTREIIYANKSFCDFIGLDSEEVLYKKNVDIYYDYYADYLDKLEDKVNQKNDTLIKKEISLKTKSNKNIVTDIKVLLILNDYKVPLFILEVMDDITNETKFKEQNVDITKSFYEVFNVIPIAVVITNVKDNKIVFANKNALDALEYNENEFLNKNYKDINFWHNLNTREKMLKNTLERNGKNINADVQFRTKSGKIKDALLSTEYLTINNEQYLVAMAIDISESKNYQRELERTLKKQKELNIMKSQFVSMISHEYRTPLTSIMLSTDLLKRYSSKWNDDEKNKHFQRIQDTVLKMTQMMENVLILGNLDSQNLRFNPDKFNLESFCYSIAKNIETNAKDNISINYKYFAKHKEYYLDENLIGLMVTNLLNNAIKYSKPNGEVNFFIYCDKEGLRFMIQDEGIGIPKEDLEKLYNEFYRSSNTKNIAGFGLGLSIVKKAVEAHKGKINVESKLNYGTKFVITIENCQKIKPKQ